MTDATPTALEQMRAEILHGLMPCACPGTMACPAFATAVDMLRAHAAQAVAHDRRERNQPFTKAECDTCSRDVEPAPGGEKWHWVTEGYGLICDTCWNTIAAQAVAEERERVLWHIDDYYCAADDLYAQQLRKAIASGEPTR